MPESELTPFGFTYLIDSERNGSLGVEQFIDEPEADVAPAQTRPLADEHVRDAEPDDVHGFTSPPDSAGR
jgi:hypothetical protein